MAKLISPTGEHVEVTNAVAANNLIYGSGYKPEEETVEEATAPDDKPAAEAKVDTKAEKSKADDKK